SHARRTPSYTACPVCEHHVDRTSPFFRGDGAERPLPKERVKFKLLDLGDDAGAEARALFVSLCERKQAMSPVDASALTTRARARGATAVPWPPAKVPVKENVARTAGTLLKEARGGDQPVVLDAVRAHVRTATDVLRVIAVLSGADASLQATA